ncbi:hypothetical protein [Chakrabartyella piscis]|uniref:hypothetical protein n=1 Tax=Chakrabartyella piscis TaxID=2918914 RepID=UPI002958A36A|nr:hypothetical protein [Chakrabartyella piscis]
MKITESAKEVIMNILEANGAAALTMFTQSSCCGNSLGFEMVGVIEEEQPEMIDGVPVFMDDETKAWTGEVTIDADGGKLTLINPNSGCAGCGGGCH